MFGKRRGSRQDVLLITGQGDVVGATLAAGPDSIIDYKNAMAWELDSTQQFLNKGKPTQLICEWDQTPIQVYQKRKPMKGDSADDVFRRKVKEALSRLEEKSKTNGMLLWLGIVAVIFALGVTVAVYYKMHNVDAAKVALDMMVNLCLI